MAHRYYTSHLRPAVIFLLLCLFICNTGQSQVFWTEAFQNGCVSDCNASAYVGPNGAWTTTTTGVNGADPNVWYVAGSECGNLPPACGSVCGATDPSLHIGSNATVLGDQGASYLAGGLGFWFPETNMRCQSPTINCTGHTNITLAFNYIENGQATVDDATLWYFNGTIWAQIDPLAKTALTCNPQGKWTAFSILLPASANNNANVKIGFNWTNNDDNVGTDPSFAVDDIKLSTVSAGPPVAAFTASATSVCIGTLVNFTDNSTGAPTSWAWTFPSGTPPTSTVQNPSGVTWAAAGTYTVTLTATNVNGSSNSTVVITVNPTPTVTATASPSPICNGQSSTLTAGGASTYAWMPGSLSGTSVSVSPATTTTYTVTGTSAAGCINTQTVSVIVNPVPTVTATASPTTICVGQSSILTGAGASTYAWMPGSLSGTSVSVSPATTTTYTVTGTSALGCVGTHTVSVTVNPLPTVTVTASPTSICVGQNSTLTGAGASTYAWMPGSLTGTSVSVSPVTTTTYTVTGTSAAGCINTQTVSVTVNSLPSVTVTASPTVICVGQNTTLTGAGASTYAWMPGSLSGTSVSVSPATTTTYTVTGTSAAGCINTQTVSVTVNICAGPIAAFTPSSTSVCIGDPVDFTDNSTGAPTSWSWTFPSGTPATATTPNVTGVTWATAGTYTVTLTVTNVNGSTSATQVITVNPAPNVIVTASPTTICIGQFSNLSAAGAATYVWNPGNLTGSAVSVTPIVTTTYTIVGTSAAGCTNTAQVTVVVQACNVPQVSFLATDSTLCVGDCINFTDQSNNSPTSWTWTFAGASTGSSTQQNPTNICYPAAGTYAVTLVATNANGNGTLTKTGYIVVNPPPTANAGPNASICSGQQTTLNGTGGLTYNWMPGNLSGNSVIVTPTTTTTYTLTVTDANGCTATSMVTITVSVCSLPTAALNVSDNMICESSCVNFTDMSTGTPTGWSWSFPGATPATSTLQNPTNICYNTPGNYSVTLISTNAFGSDTIVMNNYMVVGAQNNVDAGAYVTIAIGNSTTLNASGGVGTYSWSPATGLSCTSCQSPLASPTVTTTYTVSYTNAFGCMSTDTVTVDVIIAYSIFIPSAFSPNGDNVNDILWVRGAGIKTLNFVVYDRFGEKVFESSNINDGWDGTFHGKDMNTGIYVWYVNADFYDGTTQTLKGDVSLVR
ncbi:MAG: PKD domain-containing protein [Bacteroidetes bacterium]|nr:PKD domain-containing protein [Bacteroidota bacterium]